MRNRFFIPVAPLGNKGVTLFLLALTPAFAQSAFRGFTFKKTRVHDKYLCEGVAYGDFDKDGKIDIVSGPYWYSGPDYKVRHEYFKEGRPGAEYDHYKTS